LHLVNFPMWGKLSGRQGLACGLIGNPSHRGITGKQSGKKRA